MSELNPYEEGLALDLKAALARIEELEERLKAAQDDAKEAEAYAEDMEAKLAKTVEALQNIAHGEAYTDMQIASTIISYITGETQ